MEESSHEKQHREDTLRIYQALKDALKIIAEVTSQTVATPTPPPVKNDWVPEPSLPPRPQQNSINQR